MADTANPRPNVIVFITADGQPDAYRNGNDIEINISGYAGPVKTTIVVPANTARVWAAELHLAIEEALASSRIPTNELNLP